VKRGKTNKGVPASPLTRKVVEAVFGESGRVMMVMIESGAGEVRRWQICLLRLSRARNVEKNMRSSIHLCKNRGSSPKSSPARIQSPFPVAEMRRLFKLRV
jgi:hypothetical protein